MTEPWLSIKSMFIVHGSVSYAWVLFTKSKIWTTPQRRDPYNFFGLVLETAAF